MKRCLWEDWWLCQKRLCSCLCTHERSWCRTASYGGLVDDPRGANRIDLSKAFLKDIPGILRALLFNDWLILVGHEFEAYASRFAYGQVVLFLVVHQGVYENNGLGLYIGESFFHEIVSDGFDCRPPWDFSLVSLLSKFVHCILFPSWIVCLATQNE